ncbi:Xaa-Pro aminopeptidase [Polaribacter pacificus]|uniref:Xaa-Pro aminopeptidase n=1 Tax=Polaribacter pacificus TaxID=1775173 RepID=A0A917HYU5_9FLAO|nr:M24 family metallopeptidase [Polaribacter pacificus]GGG96412.1 Xaa-Pro aminopeptidase [Polaribacter pacificus]
MRKIVPVFILFILLISCQETTEQTISYEVLNERDRARLRDDLIKDRFENLLPKLMDDSGIDMWVVISREYNEDPVLKTMLPSEWLNARRRTILVFYRNAQTNTSERLAVARYNVGDNIKSAWDKEKEPNQWAALNRIIEERNPAKIGINSSTYFALADGLVKTDFEEFKASLSVANQKKLVSAEKLAIGWVETRTEKEMKLYKKLVKITHEIIDEAFSAKVITPGKTTTEDVVWWMRQKVTDLGLETWFHPTVDVQRNKEPLQSHIVSFSKGENEQVIMPQDLLHCDFGISYLGLNTDCQQHAYVLGEAEKEVPDFLVAAFSKGNKLQDILTSEMQTGKTGNQILATSLQKAKAVGLQPSIYSHPLGNFGHSAGTTIGMWDSQDGVPVNGDYPLHNNTVYAIELNVTVAVKEWQKDIRIMLEEAGYFGAGKHQFVNGRQEAIKPIKISY